MNIFKANERSKKSKNKKYFDKNRLWKNIIIMNLNKY